MHDEEAIKQEVTKYEALVKIQEEKKKPKPMKTGVLIFDETKVQSKIIINMTGKKVMGFAMSPDELPFLHDIFFSVDKEYELKTSYVLQFIWRDLTSLPTASLVLTLTLQSHGTNPFSTTV